MAHHAPNTNDPERIAYAVKAMVPFWRDTMACEVNEQACRRYEKWRDAAPGTIRKELTVLRAALNWDFAQGNIAAPAKVWLPKRPDPKDRWLTTAEAARLLRAARKSPKARWHLALFILIGLYTGARKEAILSLRWPQVDLERNRIDFNPHGRERTRKGRPIIPIPRRLRTFLMLAQRRGTATGHVLSYTRTVKGKDGKPKTVTGPLANVKRSFETAAIAAGLVTRFEPGEEKKTQEGGAYVEIEPVTDVTPHVLRHTSASWMVQRGVSFARVAGFLGHADSRTTEQVYAHHAPDYLDDARAALDREPM